ncbi:hypothetical protein [Providencia sp.]|uniref:hypothetical protein n=1 Tax=Providencia sp. TaxID=589 RepID=UPI003F99B14E
MTVITDKLNASEVIAPDVLVGGTPCQAFSVVVSATEKLLVVVAIALGFMYWLAMGKASNLSKENELLSSQLSASKLLSKVTQSAITIHYQVSLDNIKAKQLEDSEHVKVKTVIKTVLKDNECANTAVPDDVVSELRKYAAEINTRSVATDTGTTNR